MGGLFPPPQKGKKGLSLLAHLYQLALIYPLVLIFGIFIQGELDMRMRQLSNVYFYSAIHV